MRERFGQCLRAILGLVALIGCGRDDGGDGGDGGRITALDLVDAEMLVVIGSDSPRRTISAWQEDPVDGAAAAGPGDQLLTNLYKITVDGAYEPVGALDADGELMAETNLQIRSIQPLNDDYVVLSGSLPPLGGGGGGGESDGSANSPAWMVRKSDGAVFAFPFIIVDYTDNFKNQPVMQTDAAGLVYYLDLEGAVQRLTLQEGVAPSHKQILPTGQIAEKMAIDAEGNCLYYAEDLKIVKAGGGIAAVDHGQNPGFWVGSDGKFYMSSNDSLGASSIARLDMTGGVLTQTPLWTGGGSGTSLGEFASSMSVYFRFVRDGSVLFIGPDFAGTAWEFFESDGSVVPVSLPLTPEMIVETAGWWYMIEDTKLYKVSRENYASMLVSDGDYEFYAFAAAANDALAFSALRYTDGKKVIGRLVNDQVQIFEEEGDIQATAFLRLK